MFASEKRKKQMSHTTVEMQLPVGQVKSRPVAPRHTRAGTLTCLIVSPDADRRRALQRAAERAGWQTVVYASAERARVDAERTSLHLALIDALPGDESLSALCAPLAKRSGLLLVVCGNEDDPQQEIWARQLGCWLYLPGALDTPGVESLCREAKAATERLSTNEQAAGVC